MPAGDAQRRRLRGRREVVAAKWSPRSGPRADLPGRGRGRTCSPCRVDLSVGQRIMAQAPDLVQACRAHSHERSLLDSFLQEFGPSNEEGIALMRLAESLLRVPGIRTDDELVAVTIDTAATGGNPELLELPS